jgi:hypothetical protein
MCRSWIDYGFDGSSRQRLVNQVLGNPCRLQYSRMVTLPSGQREIATTWEHFQFAPDGDYGTAQGVVSHDFWVSFFFIHSFFFITRVLMHILFCSSSAFREVLSGWFQRRKDFVVERIQCIDMVLMGISTRLKSW